jgi:D-alanyl-lipoteichoic acid acyltransferase DltB (MBOAT superfamily)
MVATLFFAFQIYCDFSAYTDIAIGTARIMGFDLMENFRQPYFARSVREFWGRWHISLSTWFRDYLYIPLGGNRVPFPRQLFNLLIVFLVSGLWHGASWTFVIWGGLHGLFVVGEAIWERVRQPAVAVPVSPIVQPALTPAPSPSGRGERNSRRRWGVSLRIAVTFAAVCFAWIFFRANSLPDAAYIVSHLFAFGNPGGLTDPFASGLLSNHAEFIISFGLIGLLVLVDRLDAKYGLNHLFRVSPAALRWAVYYVVGSAILFSGLYGSGAQEFIYFQF